MRPFIQFRSRYIEKCHEFYLAFHINDDWFAANFPSISGFSKDYKFKEVQENNSFITGIACVNNEYLPVINLKKKIGMNCKVAKDLGRLIVIETEICGILLKFAIFYESIGDAFEIPKKRVLPVPNIGKYFTSGYVKGLHVYENQCIYLLDFNTIFSLDDLIDIKVAVQKKTEDVFSE